METNKNLLTKENRFFHKRTTIINKLFPIMNSLVYVCVCISSFFVSCSPFASEGKNVLKIARNNIQQCISCQLVDQAIRCLVQSKLLIFLASMAAGKQHAGKVGCLKSGQRSIGVLLLVAKYDIQLYSIDPHILSQLRL